METPNVTLTGTSRGECRSPRPAGPTALVDGRTRSLSFSELRILLQKQNSCLGDQLRK